MGVRPGRKARLLRSHRRGSAAGASQVVSVKGHGGHEHEGHRIEGGGQWLGLEVQGHATTRRARGVGSVSSCRGLRPVLTTFW